MGSNARAHIGDEIHAACNSCGKTNAIIGSKYIIIHRFRNPTTGNPSLFNLTEKLRVSSPPIVTKCINSQMFKTLST